MGSGNYNLRCPLWAMETGKMEKETNLAWADAFIDAEGLYDAFHEAKFVENLETQVFEATYGDDWQDRRSTAVEAYFNLRFLKRAGFYPMYEFRKSVMMLVLRLRLDRETMVSWLMEPDDGVAKYMQDLSDKLEDLLEGEVEPVKN